MKKLIIAAAILAISLASAAQSPEVIKAGDILDRVSAKTKSYTSIKAEFSFTMENLQIQESDTYEGSILIKGNKYKASVMGALSLIHI